MLKNYRSEVKAHKEKGLTASPFKYFFRWRRALQPGASSVKDESPWLTFEVIDFMKANIRPDHKVFEFGGGGSTLFFLKRVKELVTVEHDGEWFRILQDMVTKKGYTNWNGKFIAAGHGTVVPEPDTANPDHFASTDKNYSGVNFRDYATAIDIFPDSYFDWVIVDGRARPSCIKQAIPRIRPGGYLVLDNSNRDYYTQQTGKLLKGTFDVIIDNYGPSPYNGEFCKTTVWRKRQ